MNAISTWNSPPHGTNSTKSSSVPSSFQLDEGGFLNDLGHFEDIGLDDERPRPRPAPQPQQTLKSPQGLASLRDLTLKRTASYSGNSNSNGNGNAGGSSLLSTDHLGLPGSSRRFGGGSRSPDGRRSSSRHTSPNPGSRPQSPGVSPSSSTSSPVYRRSNTVPITLPERKRRGSTTGVRKTAAELEKECDSDGDDEIPADAIFWNVPVSPRFSRNISASTSPDRENPPNGSLTPKPYGNGTARSPTWSGPASAKEKEKERERERGDSANRGRAPLRSKSWNDSLVDELSPEARELTEKLEEYAELEVEKEERRRQMMEASPKKKKNGGGTNGVNGVNGVGAAGVNGTTTAAVKKHVDLPPLQTSNGMIDPLPISKEKEAVLSRTRPSWLPPKSKDEERRHLKEYQKMMQLAREAERKKAEKERLLEEQREKLKADIHRIWESQILPDWDNAIVKPETRELWWQGVAPRCRSAVWSKALGNHLATSEDTFRIALERAKEVEKASMGALHGQGAKEREMFEAIRRDVGDTFPDLKIFQENGPLHQGLLDLLFAYSMYRSDVGYVYGTHVIAAILLLNQPPITAFISLTNLLNRPVPLAFYTQDHPSMARVYTLFLRALHHKLPTLYTHLTVTLNLPPQAYLESMFLTLFSLHVPLDVVSRLWDVYVFEGDGFLVRTAVAVCTVLESRLYGSREEVVATLGWRGGVWGVGREEEFLEIVRRAGKEEGGA